jgi:hypothetical protein
MSERIEIPTIAGPWRQVAGNPDLGDRTDPRQQPVDFAVWRAADGTWQLWSCIRGTRCGGKTRLFYRWEGRSPEEGDWRPMGVAMEADPGLGETPGGLQAPHVVRGGGRYVMAYGDWVNVCMAESDDGKAFRRVVGPSGGTGLFSEGPDANTRDPMLLRVGDRWHCYYTAYPGNEGAVFCRESADLREWGPAVRVAFGGAAGTGPYAAECPHVVERDGLFYLFRTQRYGPDAVTRVYRSRDPLRFGIHEDDPYLCAELPIAAPEVFRDGGRDYLAALNPGLDGIRIARLEWA